MGGAGVPAHDQLRRGDLGRQLTEVGASGQDRPRREARLVGDVVRETDLVQGRVELALDAAGRVVGRTAVPQQDQPAGGAQLALERPAARSTSRSTNGMTGQSFHSRSRA